MNDTLLQLTIRASVNRLYVLASLREDDLQTADRLVEDLRLLHVIERAPEIHFIKIESKEEIIAAFTCILSDCAKGAKPLIHIEMHGDENKGLELSSGQYVTWEWLNNRFREINRACNMQLGVVLAACFGIYAIKPIKLEQRTPFLYLIAPEKRLGAGIILDSIARFYRKLFESGSMDEAVSTLDPGIKPFYAEKFLTITLAKYIKKGCLGQNKEKRKEALITNAINNGISANRANLRKMRKFFKDQMTPKPALATKYANQFLGHKLSIDFEQLKEFAKSLKD